MRYNSGLLSKQRSMCNRRRRSAGLQHLSESGFLYSDMPNRGCRVATLTDETALTAYMYFVGRKTTWPDQQVRQL